MILKIKMAFNLYMRQCFSYVYIINFYTLFTFNYDGPDGPKDAGGKL